jgi:hypothetical protein
MNQHELGWNAGFALDVFGLPITLVRKTRSTNSTTSSAYHQPALVPPKNPLISTQLPFNSKRGFRAVLLLQSGLSFTNPPIIKGSEDRHPHLVATIELPSALGARAAAVSCSAQRESQQITFVCSILFREPMPSVILKQPA